jgi:hypothetical protein
VIGARASETHDADRRATARFYRNGKHEKTVYGDIETNYDATGVDLELHGLSPALAADILRLVQADLYPERSIADRPVLTDEPGKITRLTGPYSVHHPGPTT